jgi:hypothetical protein
MTIIKVQFKYFITNYEFIRINNLAETLARHMIDYNGINLVVKKPHSSIQVLLNEIVIVNSDFLQFLLIF